MCIAVFAWKIHPDYPLVFAGNRDELHARLSLPAGFWEDAPRVLGGRDLKAGGTWLGVSTGGRFALVTNYRDGPAPQSGPRSRGELTADFLRGTAAPPHYLQEIRSHMDEYAGFSLIVGERDALWYFSNRGGEPPRAITPGIHGLSNHLLDTPWPKVTLSKTRLQSLLARDACDDQALFELLNDRRPAPEQALPDTGIGRERERQISPVFVVHPQYGSRCSNVIFFARDGSIRSSERRFDPAGAALETRAFHIAGEGAA